MQKLRPYQTQAIAEIKERFRSGQNKVLLHLATGGGKTVVFSEMLIETAARSKRAIMVVRGRELVNQASKRLFREHVPHGVLQANHWNKNYKAAIQICSIDTMIARDERPEADLVVIDEAHMATTGGFKKFLERYRDKYIVAVTATPYTRESLRHLADSVVHPIGIGDLIDQGYLVPPKYFAPSIPDLDGVKTQQGDYVSAQLEERMHGLTGDIVSHWQQLGENRPTVCFAVNIHHSLEIVDQFNRAGIKAEHIEGTTSNTERELVLERLKNGETKVVCNVGVLCTGVDMPYVSCLIMARPTKSYNLYIQQAGRGTRPYPGKENFILLDHAGNVLRHGFITQEREVLLDGIRKEKLGGPEPKQCKACYTIYEVGFGCPNGCVQSPAERTDASMDVDTEGRLTEIVEMPFGAEVHQFVEKLKIIQKNKGYKKGWLWHQVKEHYGEDIANVYFPPRKLPWFL